MSCESRTPAERRVRIAATAGAILAGLYVIVMATVLAVGVVRKVNLNFEKTQAIEQYLVSQAKANAAPAAPAAPAKE